MRPGRPAAAAARRALLLAAALLVLVVSGVADLFASAVPGAADRGPVVATTPAVPGPENGSRGDAAMPALDAFLAEPAVRAVTLSPSGDRVAYLLDGEPARRIGILDTAPALAGDAAPRTWPVSPQVEALYWRPDGRGLFLEADDVVAYLADEPGSRPALVARLDAERRRRFAGVDPALPDAALLRQEPKGGPYRLLRLDADGHTSVLYESPRRFGKLLLAADGRPAFVETAAGDGADGADAEVSVLRASPDGGWREVLRCAVADACVPVAWDGERLLVRSRGEAGRWELAALDLRTPSARHTSAGLATVHRDPRALADLDHVVLDPTRGTPLLAVYDTDRLRSYALDPAVAAPLARLGDLLPGHDLFVAPRPGGTWLVSAADARWQRPRHYLFDTSSGDRSRLRPILEVDRLRGVTLAEDRLAARRHFSYRASDGRTVYGFVSLPPAVPAAAAPLVVRIHGGPWNHVRSRFDVVTQFLVSRGYVVFEPNFRASDGYGYDYMRAARGELADGRVHQDVLDGVDHLLAHRLGDPRRVAIVGHSFGGYSTLGALAWSPHRFRAGVAMAPPVDLVRALSDLDPETRLPNGLLLTPLLRELMTDFSDPRAVAALRGRSPEARYADTEAPLLILAGGRDALVDRVDVEHYALALDELDRDVSLLVDDDRGHHFDSRVLRRATLFLLERFLARHLGGPRGGDADPRLAAYLAANLRLTGASLDAGTLGFEPGGEGRRRP